MLLLYTLRCSLFPIVAAACLLCRDVSQAIVVAVASPFLKCLPTLPAGKSSHAACRLPDPEVYLIEVRNHFSHICIIFTFRL